MAVERGWVSPMDYRSLPPQLVNLLKAFVGRNNVLGTIYQETGRSVKIVVEQLSSQRLRRLYSESEGSLSEHLNVYKYNSKIREQGKSLLVDLRTYEEELSEADKLTGHCVQLMLWNERERLCYLGGSHALRGNHNSKRMRNQQENSNASFRGGGRAFCRQMWSTLRRMP